MIAEIETGLQQVRPGKEVIAEQWMHEPRPQLFTTRHSVHPLPCEVPQYPEQPEGNDATALLKQRLRATLICYTGPRTFSRYFREFERGSAQTGGLIDHSGPKGRIRPNRGHQTPH